MTRHRITALLAAVMLLGVGLCAPFAAPASAAAAQDELTVTIDSLSPTYLRPGKPVTLSGRITNPTTRSWSDLKVYLVAPRSPLTSSAEVADALADPTATSTGERVTALDAIGQAGDLGPGDTTTFTLSVRWAALPVSGASGVYPVGAQVLATDDDGKRANEAVGRAYTLMPTAPDPAKAPTSVSVVWSFVAPLEREASGRYAGSADLIRSVSPGGRLRRLLDLAESGGATRVTVLVDPALLDALGDIADGSYGPPRASRAGDTAPTPTADKTEASADSEPVRAFLDDLVAFAKRQTVWAVPYGNPDVLALTKNANAKEGDRVAKAAVQATDATLTELGLSARRIFWPAGGISSAKTLARSPAVGTDAAVLSSAVVPDWTDRAGPFLQVPTGAGATPVVVQGSGSGAGTTLDLRQRLVSEAALAAARQDAAPAVALVVDPTFEPGREWASSRLYDAFTAPWISAVAAGQGLGSATASWPSGLELPARLRPTPISRAQVRAAAAVVARSGLLTQIAGSSPARSTYYDETAALAVSQRWRSSRAAGVRQAEAQVARLDARLGKVKVEVTQYNTLSGSRGKFPITILNDMSEPVTVGLHLESDNPDLRIADVKAERIAPGRSRTVTVSADVGDVSTSGVTARLTTASGQTFGAPTTFSVRSSAVGTIIWVVMGLAGVVLVAALVRRVLTQRRTRDRVALAGPTDTGGDDR